MNQSTIDIERVVREVLAELAAAPQEAVAKPQVPQGLGTSVPSEAATHSTIDNHQSTMTVAARVVTMNDVGGRLDSVRRLVVAREAIVTPAVRDELLRRGIALEFASSSNGAPATTHLSLMTSGTEFDPTALIAVLAREGFLVKRSSSDCLIAASDELAAEILRPDTLGVLLSPHAAASLCLANRLPGVRAVGGIDAPAVAAASAAVGANLLVADPRAGSFFQLKQAITEFARGGVRPCPGAFCKRLG